MEIRLQTLTPLWTGGVETGNMDRIHETGIIGSLRWWYEVIVRGLGGEACDPSQHKCSYDPDQPNKGLCDACQVFGATGWQRRVRMTLGAGTQLFCGDPVLVPSGRIYRWTDRKGNPRSRAVGWYLGAGQVGQDIQADFRSTVGPFDFEILVVPTLKLVQEWTALGAKEQNGYGVVNLHRVENGQKIPLTVSKIQQNLFPGQRRPDMLPALTDFFFCKVRFRPKGGDWWKDLKEFQLALNGKVSDSQGTVTLRNQITVSNVAEWFKQDCFPLVPVLKNWLRNTVFASLDEGQSNFVFGTVDTVCPRCYEKVNKRWNKHKRCGCDLKRYRPIERVRSKIGLSFAYKVDKCWECRVWGWMPQQEVLEASPRRLGLDRERDILKLLYDSFRPDGSLWRSGPFKNVAEFCQPWHWREFGSDRDSTGSIYTDSYEFLRSLVIAKEAN